MNSITIHVDDLKVCKSCKKLLPVLWQWEPTTDGHYCAVGRCDRCNKIVSKFGHRHPGPNGMHKKPADDKLLF